MAHAGARAGAITAGADKAKCLADAVQAGSQEQARSLEQISKAISQMEQVTQQTAASAEESASAGLELSAQSETLRTIIGHLAELVGASTEDAILAAGHSEFRKAKAGGWDDLPPSYAIAVAHKARVAGA